MSRSKNGIAWLGGPLLAVATVLIALSFCAVVEAEPRPVQPSAQQLALHGEGVAAARAGEWDKAVAIFRKSLALGELNLTWLNLGRTLQYAGRCDEARLAYLEAIAAPKVARPSAAAVAEVVVRYRQELDQSCTGTLRLVCKPLNIRISLDGEASQACDGRPVALRPGVHVLVAETVSEKREVLFEIEAGKPSKLELTFVGRGSASLRKSFMPKISESASGDILK